MAETIYLHGAEDVRAAANTMRAAADEMKQAAASMAWTFELHQRFLNEWLAQFADALKEAKP